MCTQRNQTRATTALSDAPPVTGSRRCLLTLVAVLPEQASAFGRRTACRSGFSPIPTVSPTQIWRPHRPRRATTRRLPSTGKPPAAGARSRAGKGSPRHARRWRPAPEAGRVLNVRGSCPSAGTKKGPERSGPSSRRACHGSAQQHAGNENRGHSSSCCVKAQRPIE